VGGNVQQTAGEGASASILTKIRLVGGYVALPKIGGHARIVKQFYA